FKAGRANGTAVPIQVRMPVGIADVKIAITADVIKVVAEQAAKNTVDTWVVEQAGQILALVDKRHDDRTHLALMGFAIHSATPFCPNGLKGLLNLADDVR